MKLVIFANAVEDNPFMAGAFWGVSEGDVAINTGVSGPGVVQRAIADAPNASFEQVCEKKSSRPRSRFRAWVSSWAKSRPSGWGYRSTLSTCRWRRRGPQRFGGPDSGNAGAKPCWYAGDHGGVGTAERCGQKKGGIMAAEKVGGLSGAFIPVSEDANMIAAAEAGRSASKSSRR